MKEAGLARRETGMTKFLTVYAVAAVILAFLWTIFLGVPNLPALAVLALAATIGLYVWATRWA